MRKMFLQADEQIISCTHTFYGNQKDIGVFAMASVTNRLAAEGCSSCTVDAEIFVPPHAHKSRINTMRKNMERAAARLPVDELDIKGAGSPAAAVPFVTVTGIGMTEKKRFPSGVPRAGQDIVLTRWIGLDGMLRITAEKEAELSEHFTPAFIKQIKAYDTQIFALKEIAVAKAMSVSVIRQVSEGGILAALWELAQETGTGLLADMKKISIRQETIEVCEYFRLNPYQLSSTGCLLIVTDRGEELADTLIKEGIQASVIGRLTDNNDKIIRNGEEVRYIDRPAPDELMKIF